MKGVQCYELFGGIALKNHAFSFLPLYYLCIQNRHSNELGMNRNNVFGLVRRVKIESIDFIEGMFMRGNDGSLYFHDKNG